MGVSSGRLDEQSPEHPEIVRQELKRDVCANLA